MKKFLIPVDFSDTSAHTLKFALEFNKYFFAHLDLIHLFDVPFAIADEEGQLLTGYESYRKNYEDELWDFVKENKEQHHADIQVHASAGGYYQGIMNFAKESKTDLIIIGNRGKGKSKPFRFGSVARYLITHPDVPVLSVPENYDNTEIRKFVLATDLSEKIPDTNFDFVKTFAGQLKADIDVIHISLKNELDHPKQGSIIEQITQQLGKAPVFVQKRNDQHVHEAIGEYLTENNAQLLVTFPHFHSWIDQLFLGSETAKLIKNANVLMLSMPDMGDAKR